MSENTPITLRQVAEVIAYVDRLDLEAKLNRVDKIAEDQPAVLGAVVQLHSLGVDHSTQEHALHVLLFLYECFTRSVPDLPRISPEMVQAAFDNNAAMLRFYDGMAPKEATRLQQLATLKHPELNVLAYVVGYLHDQFPSFSRENELVINACMTMLDAFVEVKQSAESPITAWRATSSASTSRRKRKIRRRKRR